MTTLSECRLLDLPRIERAQGNLTPVQGCVEIPFSIARVYYLYDIVGGADRGGHAHYELEQLIIAVMGSFTVVLDDGSERQTVQLTRGYRGLYVARMIWRELVDFSSGAVCLVLASMPYAESDYIRDYEAFARIRADYRTATKTHD